MNLPPARSASRRLRLVLTSLLGLLTWFFQTSAFAGFGFTDDGKFYTVDTGAGLVFKVGRDSGGITSIAWNGVELNGPKASGLASGFGGVTTKATVSGNCVVIVCTTDANHGVIPDLTHYFVVRNGVNNIYMATLAPRGCTVGELRWITRLKDAPFPHAPISSDLRGTNAAIESKDVFGNPSAGITRSKYYGNQRAMELSLRGVTGPGVGVFMAYGSRESSSGGPFYRDIQNQTVEVYNYMYSGHGDPDGVRFGLHGPYTLCFTDGTTPLAPDTSFLAALGLAGFVGPADRGKVACAGVAGRDARYPYVVGFSNAAAQYWTVADATSGAFTSPAMKPGVYTMQLYKHELSVHREDAVTVTKGTTTTHDPIKITDDPSAVVPLWRIGDWDGTPLEFLNGDKLTAMHPSDKRMASWDPGVYVVGSSTPAKAMQACQWKAVPGNRKTIQFTLTAAQVKASTVRIGITCATGGGRPEIKVNDWNGPSQRPSAQGRSRTLTVGTYRGNNTTFTYAVPAGALVAGTNTLTFGPASGSGGEGFLSPGYGLDCVDFLQASPQGQ